MTGDRLSMPSAMPADVAERLSDVHRGEIPKWALDQARQDLTEKLLDGKKVGECDVWALIESEVNSDRWRIFLDEMTGLLLSNADDILRSGAADKMRDGMIERFLSTGLGEEAVHERAEDILADREVE